MARVYLNGPFVHSTRPSLVFVALLLALGVGAVVIVSSRLSAPPYDGPGSDHFDGRTFSNLEPFPDKSLRELLQWRRSADPRPWTRWIDEPPGPRPAERVSDGTIRVTWVN